MTSDFLTKLIDWKSFELFVADIYKESDELTVEHNLTLTGKSGATRQIDVRVTHKTKLHTYTTLIECKKWKRNVTRERIDILAESIRELKAVKGVIFTTKGFQKGAVQHAKHNNIDIFIVRDLTEDEWGQPGRNILLYLQFFNAAIQNIKVLKAQLKPSVANPPQNIKLDIIIKENFLDENQYLLSLKDEKKGKHLVTLLLDVRNNLLSTIGNQIPLFVKNENTNEIQIAFKTKVHLDFKDWEFCRLKYPFGFIKLEELEFEVISTIDQNKFESDRASELDFALVVENYISKQKNVISKPKNFTTLSISEQLKDYEKPSDKNIIKNGSTVKIYLEPFVSLGLKSDTEVKETDNLKLKPK